MLVKNYESFLQKLNFEIQNGSFDVEKNKSYIEKIIEIYNESKEKNFAKVKELIESIEDIFSINEILPACPSAECVGAISTTRYWETTTQDEENIENFNSVEVISAIFLQNLKEELGKK